MRKLEKAESFYFDGGELGDVLREMAGAVEMLQAKGFYPISLTTQMIEDDGELSWTGLIVAE